MNKTLTVALSMCAGVAMVGAGVFAQSGMSVTSSSASNVASNVRQGITKQLGKFDGKGQGDMMRSDTVKAAIEANDYSKLSTTEQAKITTDQFAKMVTMNTAKVAHQTAIETAIKNNDFAAFQKEEVSFRATMEANKPADANDNDAKIDDDKTPTVEQQQARFDEMVASYKADGTLPEMGRGKGDHDKDGQGRGGHDKGAMMSDTVKAAIEANDYTKLSTTEQAKITTDQFAKMVTMSATMQASKTAIETAIKNNDFTAFKSAHTTMKATMEANKPADANDSDKTRPEPTDAQLQTQFDKMVASYKADGSLPEMGMRKQGMNGKTGEKGMMKGKGNRGGDRGSQSETTTSVTTK